MSEINATIVGENQPVSGPTEGGGSIDFGAIRDKAAAFLADDNNTTKPTGAAPVIPVAKTTPVTDPLTTRVKGSSEAVEAAVEPVIEASPEEALTAAKIAELSDDDLVKVTVDGEDQMMPWKDAKGKLSGEFKFTQSMQKLATERKQFENDLGEVTTLREQRDGFKAFLKDETSLRDFIRLQYPHLLQGQQTADPANLGSPSDPNEIATVGQANQLIDQKLKSVEQLVADTKRAIESKIEETSAKIQFEEARTKHSSAITSTLSEIFTKSPVLNAIPNAEQLIRYEVSKMMTPQTSEAEALHFFKEVSQGMVDNLGKHFTANKKVQAVAAAKQKLETKSIEPAGGAAVQPKPTSFKDANGQIDLNKVKNAAAVYLDSL